MYKYKPVMYMCALDRTGSSSSGEWRVELFREMSRARSPRIKSWSALVDQLGSGRVSCLDALKGVCPYEDAPPSKLRGDVGGGRNGIGAVDAETAGEGRLFSKG